MSNAAERIKSFVPIYPALLIFGAVSAYNSYVADVGMALWIGMVIFLAVLVWYCVYLRKANQMYFDAAGKKGKSIKDKALKK